MDASLRVRVTNRAKNRCEYCRLPQDIPILPRFHLEHIIPRKHGGDDAPSNLALACHHCNLFKGANLTGIDPATSEVTPLFHPRTMAWHQHFLVHQLTINGRTPIGRTTVRVLNMNTLDRMRSRSKVSIFGLTWP